MFAGGRRDALSSARAERLCYGLDMEISIGTHPPVRPPRPEPLAHRPDPVTFLRILRRNPVETWTRAHFEQPILAGRGPLGIGAVVSDPAAIRRVLLDNAVNYPKDALQKRVLSTGLEDGLLTSEGEQWRLQRRALSPLFTPRVTASFAAAMLRNARDMADQMLRLRPGRAVDVQPRMASVTLAILGETIFSDGLGRDPKEFLDAMSHFFATIGKLDLFDLLDFPDWLPRISKLRSRPAVAFFESAVDDLIARRKALLEAGEPAPDDLLTLLIQARDPQTGRGLGDFEVKANIMTFIAAGHETTANALTWALFLLSLAPDWQARLAREAEALLDGPIEGLAERLVETRAVIEEAMRLYPPVASLSRAAMDADDLCGVRIRKGTLVVISPYVLHRHELLWNDPGRFDPTRFLPGAREKIDRYAYLPFGAGPRICIGAAFSMQEAVLVLASLMRRFVFSPVPGHIVTPVQRITLRPQGGMPLILTQRKPA